ncbi:transposase [Limnohabitans radicicola]|uniref:Transposase n=1 Tax=Limnohabitans radicicola TaxID=2771427 RepID=A0A927FE93_9BURK|nr:transposase [Limnohabitans radicicola]MBD8049456.1 transposase [Limnohabitans radicicola]
MARQPRLTVAAYPHHVIQRGNDRQAIVRDDVDRERLLALWQEHAQTFKVAIHSYVVMDNHFHLLVTPETDDGLPQMMQAVGRAYVRYFNLRHHRTGTLWEGRYRSNLIESERYLLACMAYIDLNPVRAGMVAQAADFKWSSHRHCIGQVSDKLVTPHALFWGLGNTPFAREAAYAEWVQSGLAQADKDQLTRSALSGWALGSPGFVEELQQSTTRRLAPRKAGRPFKKTVD